MGGQASQFAYAALLIWIAITVVLFAQLRPSVAAMCSIIGGVMFLPERVEFDPPLLPPFDKEAIPVLSCLAAVALFCPQRYRSTRPFRGIEFLFVLLILGWVVTVITNPDPIPFAVDAGQAMRPYDVASGGMRTFVWVFAPFFLGRMLFRDSRDLYDFMRIMVGCGLLYSLFAFFELRMSPQLHRWVYGFFQHNYLQQMREGGYRPMVFMTHGLNVSRFFVSCLMCAAALSRIRVKVLGVPSIVWVAYLFVVVLLCKSVGSILFSFVFVPVVLFFPPKSQMLLALAISVAVFAYPALRIADVVPTDTLVDLAGEHVNETRARSLHDRFEGEDQLLGKLMERPWFGWGTYSRPHVFDPRTGEDLSTTDGEWLVVFGSRGAWGFACWFGLYLFPVWVAFRHRRQLPRKALYMVSGLCIAAAILGFENLPNSTGTYPQFFVAGVLSGTVAGIAERERVKRRAGAERSVRSGARAVGVRPGSVPALRPGSSPSRA